MSGPIVAIVSPGNMGAAIGARLHAHGVKVVTPSGRSRASEERARSAGLQIVDERMLGETNFVFSIVPPGEAVVLAARLAPVVGRGSKQRPLYIDWNAVSPDKTRQIADIIGDAGGRFADGSIIGLPPGPEGAGPSLYASGPEAAALSSLEGRGVRFELMAGPVGAASALKMAYAGITKGMIALGAAMLLAAKRAGCDEAFVAELSVSQAQVLAAFRRSIPDMFAKAERWVPELQEIAQFVGRQRSESAIYDGIAEFYADIAADVAGKHEETSALASILKASGGLFPR
jgi:putative dehydrogenase